LHSPVEEVKAESLRTDSDMDEEELADKAGGELTGML
jgi:hypothetical protein